MAKQADVGFQADLARRLKAARALSGKKVRDVASELGWSDEKLYRFERADQIPDALELAEIAQATGQPIDFFFGGETSRPQDEGPVLQQSEPPVKRRGKAAA
jgi:transcriptional regulator with XRE-family HTH domain